MNDTSPAGLRTPPSYPESALPPGIQKLQRPTALIKAQSLAFLMFEKPDLPATKAFLDDFGMLQVAGGGEQLTMRGHGSAPAIYVARRGRRARYIGAAFTVASKAELERLQADAGARRLDSADIPGGGSGVELMDPAGNLLWLVTGQRPSIPRPLRAPLHPYANCHGEVRRVNATVRPPLVPAAVVGLATLCCRRSTLPACEKRLTAFTFSDMAPRHVIDATGEGFTLSPEHMAFSPLSSKKRWTKAAIIDLYNSQKGPDQSDYPATSLGNKSMEKVVKDIVELLTARRKVDGATERGIS
ncbi:hypothetical protein HHL21_07785 [Massilia sp. RP-1-19]|uniref:VOC domain-containing protein n=1 Tax=Massilia polaris TaxID=2728846 RepID=A0A848HHV6_9BURK|nr:hypothetical protein [Massilia polaris]NML60985.1 hypothetical protein [Massilia polaris]